jgi:hypothetical protein
MLASVRLSCSVIGCRIQVGLEPYRVLASSWGSSSNVTLSPTGFGRFRRRCHCAVVQNVNEQHVGHYDEILRFPVFRDIVPTFLIRIAEDFHVAMLQGGARSLTLTSNDPCNHR